MFKKFLLRLTAAGTAPDFNRIPFSLLIPGKESVIPKDDANIENLIWIWFMELKKIQKMIKVMVWVGGLKAESE